MHIHKLSTGEWGKALGLGIANGVVLSVIMIAMKQMGVSPLPKPLGLAFAETLIGRSLPLPVGLLFHLVYVTLWSMAFVVLFRNSLTLWNALLLALVLWLGVLLVFFPIVGWGLFGIAIGPQLILGSLMPHLLFGLFLWGLARLIFPTSPQT